MKDRFIKSSPYFFNIIVRSMTLLCLVLMVLAALMPAPLQIAADPSRTPNPVKSAWFLLWIQEMVSWSRLMVYPLLLAAVLFVALPWLPHGSRIHRASWFPREQRMVSLIAVFTATVILLLTVIAVYFRGANWSLQF